MPRLLADRDFQLWYLSRSISVAGTAGTGVALPLLVYRTSHSPGLTAAIAGLEAVPYLLFGLVFGAAADRLRRKAMMVGADLTCAALLATVPLARIAGILTPWQALAVAFAVGTGFCWFDSAAWGAVTRLVGRDRLTEANSLVWSTEVAMEVVVPAGAGVLAAATDPSLILGIDAATYLFSALCISRVRAPLDPAAAIDKAGPATGVRDDIRDGLRYIWRQPVIRALSLAGFAFNVSAGGVFGLLVVHADQVLGLATTDRRIGVLYTAAAVGSFGAAMLLTKLTRWLGDGQVSLLAYGLLCAAVLALVVVPAFGAALVLWAAWEVARSTGNLNGITLRQRLTPDELQGRVNTTGRMIAYGGAPFGALLGGAVAQAAGVRVAYLVLAVPPAIGLAALLASPVRGLRLTTGSGASGSSVPSQRSAERDRSSTPRSGRHPGTPLR